MLIAWLFVRDVRRRPAVSAASWLVLIWAVIFASRPVSAWFQSGQSMSSVEDYLEGSPIDRAVYLGLIVAGYIVLFARRASLSPILRRNGPLLAFYAFWAVSVLWSDYPFVAFKRWFKDFGAVVMILVLLTERDPTEAIKAVFVRSAYLLVPMSVLFVRFLPEIGRAYTGYNRDELMYVGVATHKNTLGALLLVSCVFLVWDLASASRESDGRRRAFAWVDGLIVLGMSAYLLRIANSATALLCTVFGLGLFFVLGRRSIQKRMGLVEVYAIAGAVTWFTLDSMFQLNQLVVGSVGRDMTLTTRTDAWQLFLVLDLNPVIGAGFKSFWAGDRMTRIWMDFPGIVQAHNGYIETYLEGGFLGLMFLAYMLLSGLRRIKRHLIDGDDFARVRLTFLVIVLLYNFSEAAFTQLSLLWIVTLLVVAEGTPMSRASDAAQPTHVDRSAPVSRWHRTYRLAASPRHQLGGSRNA
jgi:exopolysaccharide production protein ExoQ